MKSFKQFNEGNLSKLKSLKKSKTDNIKSFDRLGKGDKITIGNKNIILSNRVELKTHPYELDGWYIALAQDGNDSYYITKSKNSDTYKLYKALKLSQVGSEYEPIAKSPKLTKNKIIIEDIKIPIKVGDIVLGGKFKNKKIKVKSIGKNEKGDITINNRPLLKFRIIDQDK